MSPTVFVVAATGTLGKALALDLIKIGWNVNTTTRNPESSAAKELVSAGVKVFTGDWDNQGILRDAMVGCDGLFLNLVPNPKDWEAETLQGKNILALAKSAGIKHAIYSSSVATDAPERLPHYEPNGLLAKVIRSKATIEEETRNAGFEAYTILRPTNVMANWLPPKVLGMYRGLVETGTFDTALESNVPLAIVDEHDLAAFAIAAFKDPAKFHQQEIVVASETQTLDEILAILSQATGRQLKANYLSDEEIQAKMKEEIMLLAQFSTRGMIKFVNMDEVKKWGVPLHTMNEYVVREKARVVQTYKKSL
ncbi:putative NAD dependent epimerase/dehydratase [Xylariaceae sp. FL1651]|nr:putative NAD dependent epimerase/dehydratase [Xylariaceae sp. FL1651]